MQYENPYGTTGTNVPYVNGNPASGIEGSIIPALAVQNPMTEIVNTISSAGITPIDSDLFQLAKAIQSGALNWAGTFGGTANALTATLSPAPTVLVAGIQIWGFASAVNTAAFTINVNGLGSTAVYRPDGTATTGYEIASSSQMVGFRYNGTAFDMITPLPVTGTRGFRNYQAWFTSGTTTWTAPAGVTQVLARVWGGGGGGGGAGNISAAAGGGGGGFAEGFVSVVPGTSYSVVVGVAGTSGSNNGGSPAANNGGVGGTSSFAATISATGGQGGGGAAVNGGQGASYSPGTGSGGYENLTGGNGISGFAPNYATGSVFGGSGGTSPGGGGGGAASSGEPDPGTGPGGGGAGGANSYPGGTGAAGGVVIFW